MIRRLLGNAACAALLLAALTGLPAPALAAPHEEPLTRYDCEKLHGAPSGRAGKDVVWLATPESLVTGMLAMANVTPDDRVIDLGAGDGRIAIAAARDFGATALGIEYDPDLVQLARCLVRVAGLEHRVQILEGDIFVEDFSDATVLTLFLLPQLNRCIRHRILAMRPGTRVVSHQFRMGEWRNDDMISLEQRIALLWIVPARVGGLWDFRDASGQLLFAIDLEQFYQEIRGEVLIGSTRSPIAEGTLSGDAIGFRFLDAEAEVVTFRGQVLEETITGTVTGPGSATQRVWGRPRDGLRPAVWAYMFPGCERFYEPRDGR
jgi:SAM-dependent methyltransferase